MTFTNPDKKPWRDLTDAEKGALLLAKHEGKEIELYFGVGEWGVRPRPTWDEYAAYRVKPGHVAEVHYIPINRHGFVFDAARNGLRPAYEITYQSRDGKPDLASIKMREVPSQ